MRSWSSIPLDDNGDYVDWPLQKRESLDDVIPAEVCHYTRATTALERILYDGRLRLGNLNSTNDPLESQLRIFDYNNNPKSKYDVIGIVRSFAYLKNIKVLCTSCHNNPLWEIGNQQYLDNVPASGLGHSAMWAHYSDNHKGICILFDGKTLDKNIRDKVKDNGRIRCGFIKYDYEASILPIEGDSSQPLSLFNNYKANLLCKSPEWKTEHEFRWLVYDEEKDDLFVSIENAIKGVVVGWGFHQTYIPSLIKLCEKFHIPAGQIDWLQGEPSIDYYKIYEPK